jgi:hypothetical protein
MELGSAGQYLNIQYLKTSGCKPSARAFHTMTFLPKICSAVVYGGKNNACYEEEKKVCMNDMHLLNLQTLVWIKARESLMNPGRCQFRFAHCVEEYEGNMYLFGGLDQEH